MNHCRDCNSDYATPGTCNCFAVGGKRYVAPALPSPQPWTPPYWWWTYQPKCWVCGRPSGQCTGHLWYGGTTTVTGTIGTTTPVTTGTVRINGTEVAGGGVLFNTGGTA